MRNVSGYVATDVFALNYKVKSVLWFSKLKKYSNEWGSHLRGVYRPGFQQNITLNESCSEFFPILRHKYLDAIKHLEVT